MYLYCVVCFRVIVAPYVRSVGHVFACEEFGVEFRVTFNAKKTQCLKFGLINDTLCKPVTLNNKMINWESNVNHLGNILNLKLQDGDDLQKRKAILFGVNKMFSNFENVQSAVLLKLFQRYCCSFYGCTLWKLDRVDDFYICHFMKYIVK